MTVGATTETMRAAQRAAQQAGGNVQGCVTDMLRCHFATVTSPLRGPAENSLHRFGICTRKANGWQRSAAGRRKSAMEVLRTCCAAISQGTPLLGPAEKSLH